VRLCSDSQFRKPRTHECDNKNSAKTEIGEGARLIDVWLLDLAGLVASFTFLGYSSWRDIVSREVPDQVWILFYPVALAMITVRLVTQTNSWPLISLSIGSAVLLSLVLPHLRLWGGADAKAFICLAIMNPLVPALDGGFLGIANPLFPLVVFSNAYIASLASILYPIQRNLRSHPFNRLFDGLKGETRFHKIAAFLTGYRVSIRELESKPFLYLLESVSGQGPIARRRFSFDLRIDSNRQRELEEIKAATDSGLLSGTVWASPGLPFLLFITVGLLLSLLLGDVMWYGVSRAMQSIARPG